MPKPATVGIPFWSEGEDALLRRLGSAQSGLAEADARARLYRYGPNRIGEAVHDTALRLLARQFSSPLVLILVFGAGISLVLHEEADAAIILAIIAVTALLGFLQEYRASRSVAALRSRLTLNSKVRRGGVEQLVPAAELVPGDVIVLSAGNLVPADARLLEAIDFLVNEASLTGESMPVEKRPGVAPADAGIAARTNAIFMGSSVRSGVAVAAVTETGRRTEFGAIAHRLGDSEPESDFARGVRRFGGLLLKIMFLIVIFVLVVNQLLGRPVVESLLFALALAVGLSPELLPAIVSITLSRGARHLAANSVMVRRLEAIENFGGMDVLCTDKTGTLTEGVMEVAGMTDAAGTPSAEIGRLAFLNAAFESGIENPMDAALVAMGNARGLSCEGVSKIDEIPYDFQRRRLTIVVEEAGERSLIAKGAFSQVLEVCTSVRTPGGEQKLDARATRRLTRLFEERGAEGYRVLALAVRKLPAQADYTLADERELTFTGFLLFADPVKDTAAGAIRDLARLGIAVKVISGDNRHVTRHVAEAVGLDAEAMLTGAEVAAMSEEALWHRAQRTDLFVEIDPQQKERIVRALQRAGRSVGYLGDGINDAPALRAADIGISVDSAVDVARETADIILLKPDLGVLRQGVEDGRRTFANTLKYISITISANFGNMISMALATPLLPFLPLLPKQILLNNFISDVPGLFIATDRVDREDIKRPQRWDVGSVWRFMLVFGGASSAFDLITFLVLLRVFHAQAPLFQTSWFLVSLLTELGVLLVLRTRHFSLTGKPSRSMLWSTIFAIMLTLALPWICTAALVVELVPLEPSHWIVLAVIVLGYLAATELLKRWFYWGLGPRKHHHRVSASGRSWIAR
jgi:Mg2+-importing ATPase